MPEEVTSALAPFEGVTGRRSRRTPSTMSRCESLMITCKRHRVSKCVLTSRFQGIEVNSLIPYVCKMLLGHRISIFLAFIGYRRATHHLQSYLRILADCLSKRSLSTWSAHLAWRPSAVSLPSLAVLWQTPDNAYLCGLFACLCRSPRSFPVLTCLCSSFSSSCPLHPHLCLNTKTHDGAQLRCGICPKQWSLGVFGWLSIS